MDTTLQAMFCRTRNSRPLVTLDGLPGAGADLTPDEVRALAAALVSIATAVEAAPTTGRHYRPQRRVFPVDQNPA